MRFPNQRLAQLFSLLQNETLPQDELAQRLSVSTRTVRADITALAHCYKMTRSIAFVRAEAWDVDPADPIATAQAAFILHGASAPR